MYGHIIKGVHSIDVGQIECDVGRIQKESYTLVAEVLRIREEYIAYIDDADVDGDDVAFLGMLGWYVLALVIMAVIIATFYLDEKRKNRT